MDDHLKINLKADEYEFNDPYRMCSIDRSPQTYNGHRELYDFNDVDKVFEFVKCAYKYTANCLQNKIDSQRASNNICLYRSYRIM